MNPKQIFAKFRPKVVKQEPASATGPQETGKASTTTSSSNQLEDDDLLLLSDQQTHRVQQQQQQHQAVRATGEGSPVSEVNPPRQHAVGKEPATVKPTANRPPAAPSSSTGSRTGNRTAAARNNNSNAMDIPPTHQISYRFRDIESVLGKTSGQEGSTATISGEGGDQGRSSAYHLHSAMLPPVSFAGLQKQATVQQQPSNTTTTTQDQTSPDSKGSAAFPQQGGALGGASAQEGEHQGTAFLSAHLLEEERIRQSNLHLLNPEKLEKNRELMLWQLPQQVLGTPLPLEQLPPGRIGQLVLFKSGRARLTIAGVEYEVAASSLLNPSKEVPAECSASSPTGAAMSQTVHAILPGATPSENSACYQLADVSHKLVCSPVIPDQ